MALGMTQSLKEMSTRDVPEEKRAAGSQGWQSYRRLWVDFLQKMWVPRHITTLWAFTACYKDSFTFFRFIGIFNYDCHTAYVWKWKPLLLTQECIKVESVLISRIFTTCLSVDMYLELLLTLIMQVQTRHCSSWIYWRAVKKPVRMVDMSTPPRSTVFVTCILCNCTCCIGSRTNLQLKIQICSCKVYLTTFNCVVVDDLEKLEFFRFVCKYSLQNLIGKALCRNLRITTFQEELAVCFFRIAPVKRW
jgi:hypothetical protein